MKRFIFGTLGTGLCMLLSGCGSSNQPPVASGDGTYQPQTAAKSDTQKSPNKSVIHISEEIRTACGISDTDANFDFDSARVKKGDYPVLKKLAECFKTGKLKGRQMRLVGHADPRGDSEYNLVLGGRRADGVKEYLVDKGLGDTQIATSSRGEMDAKGENEATWAKDRRVDVMLAN